MKKLLEFVSPRYVGAVTRLILFVGFMAQSNADYQTLQAQLESGDKILKEGHHYFRKKIVAAGEPAGIIDVIKGTDTKAVGEMSFDKGVLPNGEVFVISHVGLGYATLASGALYAQDVLYRNSIYNAQSYANGTVDTDSGATGNQFFPVETQLIPNKMLSAEIRFKFGNERWLEGTFRDFCKTGKINNQEGLGAFDSGAVKELGIPKVVDSSKPMGFEIEFPGNATAMGSADYLLNIDYYGLRVVDKA